MMEKAFSRSSSLSLPCLPHSPTQAQKRGPLWNTFLPIIVSHGFRGLREGKPVCVHAPVYMCVCVNGKGGEMEKEEGRKMCTARGLALWHPGGVFLLNCLSSTAVIANEKLKSTLTPAPTPAPVSHKCSLSTLLLEQHPVEDTVAMGRLA